jgi:serine/threonine protein kinase
MAIQLAFLADSSTATKSSSGPAPSIELSSRFTIERFLARGGLGEIFLANEEPLGRRVAIKIPRDRAGRSNSHRRLIREAQITGRLKHPGIVPVFACSPAASPAPCYAMQYISGQTFAAAIEAFHNQSQMAADFRGWQFRGLLQRLVAVCNTVAYAHEQGVIHRDIKPSNIMLGDFGETFLLDWGIAKVLADRESVNADRLQTDDASGSETIAYQTVSTVDNTRPGQPIGTPEFASPEQISGRVDAQTPASDVYSLGATLYQMLTGRRAIEVEDLTNLKTASAVRRIPPPRSVNRQVPKELNAICMKAIAFEPEQRYLTAVALREDLERYLADEPVSVVRASWFTIARRGVRRHPRFASALASGVLVAIAGAIIAAGLLNEKAVKLTEALESQRQSNNKLQQANEIAQSYSDAATKALRALSSRMVRQSFAKQKSFNDADREFLLDIVKQYEDFAAHPGSALQARQLRAEGLQQTAQVYELLGMWKEQLKYVESAAQLFMPLPDNLNDNELALAGTIYFDWGRLLVQFKGEFESGIEFMATGIALLQQLAGRADAHPEDRRLLATAQNKLGTVYVSLRQSEKALECFEASLATAENLDADYPENLDYLIGIANAAGNIGVARYQLKDSNGALSAYLRASAIYTRLNTMQVLSNDVHWAAGNVINLLAIARLYRELGEAELSLQTFEQALKDCEQLVQAFPSFGQGYVSLARAHCGLAAIYRDRAEFEQAIESAQRGTQAAQLGTERSPDVKEHLEVRSQVQLQLAQILAKAKQFERADPEFEKAFQFAGEELNRFPSAGARTRYAQSSGDWGYNRAALGHPDDAMVHLERVIEILESDPELANRPQTQSLISNARQKIARLESAE